MKNNRVVLAAIVAVGAMVSAQCSSSQTSLPTAPGASSSGVTTRAVGDATTATPVFNQIHLCKSAGSDVLGTFTVSHTNPADPFNANVTLLASPFNLNPGECKIIAEANGTVNGAFVTINETSADVNTTSSGQRIDNPGPVITDQAFVNGGSLYLNIVHGHTITFDNQVVAQQGCTPGYWKQSQHLDSWVGTGYAPGDDFDATFGVNFFNPNITLLQAVSLGGNSTGNALVRHAVAGLLSAGSGGVDYPYTTAQVIDILQGDGAYAGLTINQRKDLLANANELGCPLN